MIDSEYQDRLVLTLYMYFHLPLNQCYFSVIYYYTIY